MTFERVPSDYAILKLHTLPEDGSGGDTLWASGYEAYERLSPSWQKFAERSTWALMKGTVVSFLSRGKHDGSGSLLPLN